MYSVNAGTSSKRRSVRRPKTSRGPRPGQYIITSQDAGTSSKLDTILNFGRILVHFAGRAFGLHPVDGRKIICVLYLLK